jgi:hypothetical protein
VPLPLAELGRSPSMYLDNLVIRQYAACADNLKMELENGEKESSTTSGYISAINSVF